MKFLLQQHNVKSSDKIENGCIPMHRGAQVSDVIVEWYELR